VTASPQPDGDRTGTRTRLLDAAEELLLRDGYEEVSVRGICARACANASAVHYHFGSKEQLVAALLEDRLAPAWERPIEQVLCRPHEVADLVDAIWQPLEILQRDPVGPLRLSLLARFVLAGPDTGWTARWFQLQTWTEPLCELIPGLTAAEARRRWRLAFTLLLTQLSRPEPLPPAAAQTLREFLISGLAAPVDPGG